MSVQVVKSISVQVLKMVVDVSAQIRNVLIQVITIVWSSRAILLDSWYDQGIGGVYLFLLIAPVTTPQEGIVGQSSFVREMLAKHTN